MALKINVVKTGLFLLALWNVAYASEFKQKFAEELSTSMKKDYAELLKSNMDSLADFYNVLLHELNLPARDQRGFTFRLETIKEMKSRIGESITAETLQASLQFTKIIFWEIMLYQGTPAIKEDPTSSTIIRDALESSTQRDTEAIKLFQAKVYQKWRDLYKTIPAEELQKHAEYVEINDLLEKIAGIDIMENGETTKNAVENMTAALKKITEFFDIKEFKSLFEKHRG